MKLLLDDEEIQDIQNFFNEVLKSAGTPLGWHKTIMFELTTTLKQKSINMDVFKRISKEINPIKK